MALVGEARIKVVADTKHIRGEIQKAFADLDKVAEKSGDDINKSFSKGMNKGGGISANSGFSKFNKESKDIGKKFAAAVRSSYKWQAASGALLQSIMALGGGLLALAGNIAGAAASGIALVGMMAQIKLASMVAKSAFKGVMAAVKADSSGARGATKTIKELREEMQQLAFAAERAALSEEAASIKLEKAREDLARVSNLPPDNRARREAQLAYSEAELAYRMAKDKNADAQDELANPKKKNTGGGGVDPYKDLTKTQREFAIGLKEVMPRFKELNEAAASSFLPELGKQLRKLFSSGTFGVLVKGFEDISSGLAKATENFAGTMFDPNNQRNLSTFFKNAGTTTGTFGSILGNVFSGFITLMNAINPLVTRFTSFLQTKSVGFAANMKNDFANIQGFFKDAGDAAAGWGAILGRLFEKFKGMIKANVGPGTGGQLLLDFFNDGTTGFKNMDGAAGEFARKQHFLASATNLKAMLASIAQIFSFLSDLGTDPAVAAFWEKLAELEGPLSKIFESVSGSSDEFASLIVTIAEMIATLADAEQLNTFMLVLSEIAKYANGFLQAIAPLTEMIGPLIGAIGALVVAKKGLVWTTKLLNSVMLSTVKIFSVVTQVVRAATAWYVTSSAVRKAAMAGEIVGLRLSTRLLGGIALLRKKEGWLAMGQAVKTLFAAGAKTAEAAATTGLGAASGAAVAPAAALSLTINSMIWPITLVVAAIALLVIGIIALVSWMNAVKADNIKKANKELSKGFKESKDKVLDSTHAQNQWNNSLLALGDNVPNAIKDVRNLGAVLANENADGYNQAVEAMDAYMGALAKIGKKDLPEMQRQLRNQIVVSGMDREATAKSILGNEEMVKVLEDKAKAMGDSIRMANGEIDAMKLVDYAIGEGSYVRQQAILAQKQFAETFKNAADTFIDSNDAIQKSTNKGKLDLKKFLKEMTGQTTALTEWKDNIAILQTKMKDKNLLQGLVAKGSEGAALIQELVADKSGKAIADFEKVQAAADSAKKEVDLYTRAYGDTAAVAAAFRAKFKGNSSLETAFNNAIGSGAGAFELASKFNIDKDSILAEQRKLDAGGDLVKNASITAAWKDGTLEDLTTKLNSTLTKQELVIDVKKQNNGTKPSGNPGSVDSGSFEFVGPKNGGYIRRALGGLVGRFADGWGPAYNGRVTGPGTGRSDSIPAMISNGEFVVNARATAQNMDLLNAINNNKNVSGKAGNQIAITVNAAPGMDEQQVAAQVARQLDAQLSRGGSL
jgi:hypothetical protein